MDRRIKATKKDSAGNIVALGNPGESWSPLSKQDILKDIKNGRRSYYVHELPQKVYVKAMSGDSLRTTADKTSRNNLDNLPAL